MSKIDLKKIANFTADINEIIFLSTQLREGITYKTTGNNRLKLIDEMTKELINKEFPYKQIVMADIGISYGNTTYDLIKEIPNKFKTVYGIDKNNEYDLICLGKLSILLKRESSIVLLAEYNGFIIRKRYLLFIKFIFRIFYSLINKIFKIKKLLFIDNRLLKNESFSLINEDIFSMRINIFPEKINFIRVMNLLNKVYFSEVDIKKAINNLKLLLEDGGILLIGKTVIGGERDGISDATFYRKSSERLIKITNFNCGSEINDLICNENN